MDLFTHNSPAYKTYLQEHPHERGEVRFLQSIAQKGMVVVEVGGHTGLTAVAIGKQIGREGILFCFEPLPKYFEMLQKNIISNGLDNIQLSQLAVTDRTGYARFNENGDASRIDFQQGKARVTTTNLDTFLRKREIENIDLLSMDCEGSEFMALKGAEKILRNSHVQIFVEIHHNFLEEMEHSVNDIVAYLKELGFKINTVDLNTLKLGKNFKGCEYIYAHK